MVGSQYQWPFPDKLRLPWRVTSAATRLGVMLAMKVLVRGGQKVQVKNLDILRHATLSRPRGTPLVTVSNHASCIDDPAVWALFPTLAALNSFKIRWIPAAQDMCFTNQIFSAFFSRGQLVPVVRGDGVYQRGINFCIQKLNEGNWIHVFPEGKVNMTEGPLRLKWDTITQTAAYLLDTLRLLVHVRRHMVDIVCARQRRNDHEAQLHNSNAYITESFGAVQTITTQKVAPNIRMMPVLGWVQEIVVSSGVGRIIAEAKSTPTIIPFYHVGMDDMLPNYAPYIPRLFKKLTVLIGEPIDISGVLKSQVELSASAVVIRKQVTDVIQKKLYDLKSHAEELHKSWTTSLPVAYRTL